MVTYPPLTCLVIVVHESLVFPELFFSSCSCFSFSSSSCTFFGFPASAYLTLSKIHLSTLWTTEGLIHNYYKRWKHLLILKKATQCIKCLGCKLFELDDKKKMAHYPVQKPSSLNALCCLLDKLPLYVGVLFLSTTNPEKHLYTQNMKLIYTRISLFVRLICDQFYSVFCISTFVTFPIFSVYI